MPEITVAKNYLEACQSWQEVINAEITIEAKLAAGYAAMKSLRGQTFQNDRSVIVGGETAFYLPDGSSWIDEQLTPVMQFTEVNSRGWLGRLFCAPIKEEVIITWPIYNPRVLGPVQEEFVTPNPDGSLSTNEITRLPIDKTLRRPLHYPVGLINFAINYAK